MAAFLMASVIRGFGPEEALVMAEAMVASGDTVDLSGLVGPTVDKHSTGGVGDSATLVVTPILAACGLQVAKLSGRGLGHTGGTLDKLAAIPGFRVDLSTAEVRAQVERIGLAVVAATGDLVPLDKRLYALRDVTATVPNPGLIAASVMSKKLAGGADTIVLDVKVGDGAFMATVPEAIELAELCVDIGRRAGRRTGALITDMSQPLAPAIGNALEVAASIDVLTGQARGRFRELCEALAVEALVLTGRPRDASEEQVTSALDSGEAADRLRQMIDAQGGAAEVVDDPRGVLPAAVVVADVVAAQAGTVSGWRCQDLGSLAGSLGAGRRRQEDVIDPSVGLEILVGIGDDVDEGQTIARVHAASAADAERARHELAALVSWGAATPPALVHARVGPEGEQR